jgi:hypothetical protein
MKTVEEYVRAAETALAGVWEFPDHDHQANLLHKDAQVYATLALVAATVGKR